MVWVIEVTEAAVEDALMIRNWYNDQQSGLGAKFISAIESAKEKLLLNPIAFRYLGKKYKANRLTSFCI